ncbi:hypothetical protein EDB86DRAFT_2831603 [Lactarius hatsudake]|nr:hypothetical protein EDB86DRAFT_2831603 [Lactarius hatsudake]
MSPQAALTYAEVDYREAKIDSRIRQYLTAPSQEHSVELFADFIIATDMTRPSKPVRIMTVPNFHWRWLGARNRCQALHDNGTTGYVPNLKLYRYANATVCARSIREFEKERACRRKVRHEYYGGRLVGDHHQRVGVDTVQLLLHLSPLVDIRHSGWDAVHDSQLRRRRESAPRRNSPWGCLGRNASVADYGLLYVIGC